MERGARGCRSVAVVMLAMKRMVPLHVERYGAVEPSTLTYLLLSEKMPDASEC